MKESVPILSLEHALLLILLHLTAAMPSINHTALKKILCTSAIDSSIRKFRMQLLQLGLRSLSGDSKANGTVI